MALMEKWHKEIEHRVSYSSIKSMTSESLRKLHRPSIKEFKTGVASDIQTIGYRCRMTHSALEGHLHPVYLPQIFVTENILSQTQNQDQD